MALTSSPEGIFMLRMNESISGGHSCNEDNNNNNNNKQFLQTSVVQHCRTSACDLWLSMGKGFTCINASMSGMRREYDTVAAGLFLCISLMD
jgi:hypothetical protein